MLSNGRRGPRFESDADDNIQPRGRAIDDYAPPNSAKPSALAMLSLIISMLALGLAVWALAVPPDPLITPPATPGQVMGQAGGGDRVSRLENDMQRALLHLVTMEERLKKLQARLTAIAPDQAAAEPAIDPLEPIATALAPLSAAEPQPAASPATVSPAPAAPAPTPAPLEKPTPAPTPKPAPTAQPTPKPTAKATARPSVPASFTAKHIYKVKPGDNLYSVARAFGVKKEDLCAWNGLDKDTLIKVDQSLVIYK
ncbi:Peptidoglycan-binding lysin domain protein [Desulfarculus baarsii DSM 2075]|uniref:Peptidoglycan-binding lysin domain protein n=1 Tax=Desulfarculus baarsii (strain ATCC 33931 / DSM 2075 / LMG 7858 / VKM B-1802 / 2st14) TaxID=644282 RepID=E1QE04_DESB2|nr:LysM domain-containing protein [Desulfarculus baarsii]ADK83790.1 Peptidoglycan-binding lysin domain protein [Desulfarculus baarsii DSM 2075]